MKIFNLGPKFKVVKLTFIAIGLLAVYGATMFGVGAIVFKLSQ
jgi:hypothetical protein